MQVDAVAADPDRGVEGDGPEGAADLEGDVLLHDGPLGDDAPRLADVGGLGEPVGRAVHHVGPQPQARPAGAPVRPWRLGLQPVQQAEAQLPRPREMTRGLGSPSP